MPQYNKAEVGELAKEFGFVRDTFEKVLRLQEIPQFINEQEELKQHLLLKGGTAINLTVFDDGLAIQTVAPMEIFAAKGNALINRAAARDLYDWGNLIAADLFVNGKDLFRKCFAFYTTISSEKDRINATFDVSAIDSLNFTKIRRDLFLVISKKDNFKLEERKDQAKAYISSLMQLTDVEREYMERFAAKEYRPELLFEDEKIIERLEGHPMALWKCKKG